MKLTVAICTWNRAESLRGTLESLAQLVIDPMLEWELVLVDNNSTDHTQDVVSWFAGRLPIRVVSELKQGHSASRNRALQESSGEFIVWTDDDVRVCSNWLSAYLAAMERNPDASFFGGPIEPDYELPIPRWLTENAEVCDAVYARRQLGDQPFELNCETLPYGANFVTRRSVQLEFSFQDQFGRVGDELRGFDEIDVLTRMLEAGHKGYWVPDAGVQHLIPASRMTREYIRDYFFGQGQTWIARKLCEPTVADLHKRIRRHRRGYWLGRCSSSTRGWFGHWVQLANLGGQLDQLKRTGACLPNRRQASYNSQSTP